VQRLPPSALSSDARSCRRRCGAEGGAAPQRLAGTENMLGAAGLLNLLSHLGVVTAALRPHFLNRHEVSSVLRA